MFHCDEDYLSSIGGIEHHLMLNHLGSFTRMASQTRWVNTNSWENSFKSLFSHNAWFGLMGTFQKSLLADTLQTKKISICQFLRDGELWNSPLMLILGLESVGCWRQNLWIQLKLSSNISCGHPCKKTNLKCKASNFPETFEMVTPCSTTFPIYSAIVGGNSPPLLWNIHLLPVGRNISILSTLNLGEIFLNIELAE